MELNSLVDLFKTSLNKSLEELSNREKRLATEKQELISEFKKLESIMSEYAHEINKMKSVMANPAINTSSNGTEISK